MNGVVDDPLEAGDPFLDINGNGKWDDGRAVHQRRRQYRWTESASYTPPRISCGPNLTLPWQLLAEPIAFDYTNGQGDADPSERAATSLRHRRVGGVRNLESQGRQLYARHLYCLMLLLVDENYIAPWDENDPQIMTWIETDKKKIETAIQAAPISCFADAPRQADVIVKRKLTCRMIAQWADQLRRHARRRRDHDAVRIRREPVGRLGMRRRCDGHEHSRSMATRPPMKTWAKSSTG